MALTDAMQYEPIFQGSGEDPNLNWCRAFLTRTLIVSWADSISPLCAPKVALAIVTSGTGEVYSRARVRKNNSEPYNSPLSKDTSGTQEKILEPDWKARKIFAKVALVTIIDLTRRTTPVLPPPSVAQNTDRRGDPQQSFTRQRWWIKPAGDFSH